MHRRARHLNARHAGAGLVLDARRISGLNDGDAVSTWNDVSGNGWNATGTSTTRPLYKTAIQGGQPILRFNGSSNYMQVSAVGALNYTANIGYFYCIGVAKDSNESSGDSGHSVLFIATPSGTTRFRLTTRNSISGVGICSGGRRLDADTFAQTALNGSGSSFFTSATKHIPSSGVISVSKNGVFSATAALASSGNTSNTQALRVFIGALSVVPADRLDGDIGLIVLLNAEKSNSLIKRLEHSSAFSFKIQCS